MNGWWTLALTVLAVIWLTVWPRESTVQYVCLGTSEVSYGTQSEPTAKQSKLAFKLYTSDPRIDLWKLSKSEMSIEYFVDNSYFTPTFSKYMDQKERTGYNSWQFGQDTLVFSQISQKASFNYFDIIDGSEVKSYFVGDCEIISL